MLRVERTSIATSYFRGISVVVNDVSKSTICCTSAMYMSLGNRGEGLFRNELSPMIRKLSGLLDAVDTRDLRRKGS